MPAQCRSSTPPPRQRTQPSEATPVVSKEPVVEASSPSGKPSSDNASKTEFKEHARSHCTDIGCTVFFFVFTFFVALIYWRAAADADIRRLVNGFDFRGHLCGDTVSGGQRSSSGEFVYWCVHEGEGSWSSPICVDGCPSISEELSCPFGKPEVVETEESKTWWWLTTTSKRQLAPLAALPTHQVGKLCLPSDVGQTVKGLFSHAEGSVLDTAFRILLDVGELWERPFLVVCILASALLFGMVWLVLLRHLASTVVHLGMLLLTFGFVIAGGLVVFAPTATIRALPIAGDLTWLALPGWLGVNARLAIGTIFMCIGLVLLLVYCYNKSSISLAARSCQEACRIVFLHPSLLVLPFYELFGLVSVTLLAAYGVCIILSTADVQASTVHLFGESVSGLYRTFNWTPTLWGSLLSTVFACLWCQELVSAARAYVLSKLAVNLWFPKRKDNMSQWFPMLSGISAALRYHFGSLALGSFSLAVVRSLQWICIVLHKILGERKDRNSGILGQILGIFDGILLFTRKVIDHTNKNAYTDVVLTSSPYFVASCRAGELMLKNSSLLWSSFFILKPILFCAQVAYAGVFGWGVWVLLCIASKESMCEMSFLGHYHTQLVGISNVGTVAVLASLVSFVVVRAFTALEDGICSALLYCYMWDKEDGMLDGNVPVELRGLVSCIQLKAE